MFLHNTHFDSVERDADDLSLGAIAARLWRARYFIILVTAFFAVFFGTVAFTTRPIFRAVVSMIPSGNDYMGSTSAMLGSLGSIAMLAGIDMDGGSSTLTKESMAVLRSREFREAFVTDLGLMRELFDSRWDAERGQWRTDIRRPPDMQDALEKLNEIAVIGHNPLTGIYTVQVEWSDPYRAASWANAMVARLNSEMRVRAMNRSSAFIKDLEKALSAADVTSTHGTVARLLEAQMNELMLATVVRDFSFKIVSPASVPFKRSWPRRGLQTMVGTIAGGLVGSMLALFGPAIRRNIVDARRITSQCD
ncbi:MAG: Wzz/FepE/Etk N-terminal domain-containing protein [Steroidobacteraceae bacterium]